MGGDDVVTSIAAILADPQRALSIRGEAAKGLGTIGTAATRARLVEAFGQASSTSLATEILNSLGRHPFLIVAEDFQGYMAAAEMPPGLRVVAAEALAFSTPEAASFLIELAADDADQDVRAAAAWAISVHSEDAQMGVVLANLAEQEPDVDVRRRLYEAQLPQGNIPGDRLLLLVQAEQDVAARVAGFNAVGRAAYQQPDSEVARVFDRQVVPELVRIATTSNSVNLQMRAVFALRRAQTPVAQNALAAIANRAQPPIAAAARNGLKPTNS
jgi:HEAT repeat protein